MKYFISTFLIALGGIFFWGAGTVSAATTTISDCTDLNNLDNAITAETFGAGDVASLQADIACSTVLGDVVPFSGTFEGNGFTITKTNSYPLFDEVEGAVIRNLTVTGTVDIANGMHGGLAHFASNTIVHNVTNSMQITDSNGTVDIGGFFGTAAGTIQITSSTFNGSYTNVTDGSSRVGGLIGRATGSTNTFTFTDNTISGNLSFLNIDSTNDIGGLVGDFANGTVFSTRNILSGDITILGTGQLLNVGGLIGGMDANTVLQSTNDVISGTVSTTMGTANSPVNSIGGLVGQVSSGVGTVTVNGTTVSGELHVTAPDISSVSVSGIGSYQGATSTFTNFISTRTATLNNYGGWFDAINETGGVFGYFEPLSTATVTFTNVNVGGSTQFDLSGTATSTFISGYGGYVGSHYSTSSLVISGGTISTDVTMDVGIDGNVSEVGGAVGEYNGPLSITNLTMSGSIILDGAGSYRDSQYIGGLVGLVDGSDLVNDLVTISGVTVSGDMLLHGGDEVGSVGGLFGNIDSVDLTVVNTVVSSDFYVTSTFYTYEVGGFFGYVDTNTSTVSQSQFTGSISANASAEVEEIGGFSGESDTDGIVYQNVTSTGDIVVTGGDVYDIGGLIGLADSTPFTDNVYVVGDITVNALNNSAEGIGGVFGWVESELYATSTFMTGNVTVASDNAYAIGGIVGILQNDDAELDTAEFTGVLSVAAEGRARYIGGAIGDFEYDYDLTLNNIVTNGTVTTTANEVLAIGGVIGGFSDYPDDVVLTNITNNANIVIRAASSTPSVEGISGIIGHHEDDDDDQYLLTNITNNGDITIYSAIENAFVTDVGGLTGQHDAEDEDDAFSTNILQTGDITIYAAATGTQVFNVGGIIGDIDDLFLANYVTSTGDIAIYVAASSSVVGNVGGLFGNSDDDTYTNNVSVLSDITIYANGPLSDVSDVGGLIGEFDGSDWYATSSYYVGDITIQGGYTIENVGGIVGHISSGDLQISTTYAVSDITLSLGQSTHSTINAVGGFVGYDDNGFLIRDSFAAGSITISANTGSSNSSTVVYDVGGFIGSSGDISASSTYADVDITISTANDDVSYVGGYAGRIGQNNSNADISYSFAAGEIDISAGGESSGIGGFIGLNVTSTLLSNYFDIYRTGQDFCSEEELAGCAGYNENNYAETSGYLINTQSNPPVDSWDFDDVWQTKVDYYPVLAFAPYDESVTLGTGSGQNNNRSSRGGNTYSDSNPLTRDILKEKWSPEEASQESTTQEESQAQEGASEQPTGPTTPIDPTQALQCSSNVYLTNPVRFGSNNNPADVRLLEEFLNTYENAGLVVNGVYDQADLVAVIAWQEKYAASILAPWGLTQGTGYVYTTSLAKIKEIHEANCATATPTPPAPVAPAPSAQCLNTTQTLTLGMNNTLVTTAQQLLKTLGYFPADVNTTGYFGPITQTAVTAFQAANNIQQLGIIGPQTRARLNELGCNS